MWTIFYIWKEQSIANCVVTTVEYDILVFIINLVGKAKQLIIFYQSTGDDDNVVDDDFLAHFFFIDEDVNAVPQTTR